MLQYEVAKKLYEEIKESASQNTTEGFDEFYRDFLESAAEYARTRTAWALMNRAEQIEDDKRRSVKHDALISILGAICRNLEIEGADEIMPDRKTKGDFACYVALFLALEQR